MLTRICCCLATLLVTTVAPPSAYATVTKKVTTTTSGWFPAATLTYSFKVESVPIDASTYNDFHIRFERINQLDISTATHDGGAGGVVSTAPVPGCPSPCGELVFTTALPIGFGTGTTFTVTTNDNPTYIEGPQQIRFTRDGVQKHTDVSAVLISGTYVPFSTTMSFPNGALPAGSTIDLLQTTSIPTENVFLGTGTATGTGSASIALLRPLMLEPLHVSVDAASSFVFLASTSVPMLNPWGIALVALGLILAMVQLLRTRKRSAP